MVIGRAEHGGVVSFAKGDELTIKGISRDLFLILAW